MNGIKTEFGLIRHAETFWNVEKRIQGQKDTPLTEHGEIMAQLWGKKLSGKGYNRILTSDLGRTINTAKLVNKYLQIPVSQTEKLRDMDWGKWIGKTYKQIRKENPDILSGRLEKGWAFNPPGGETREQVLVRSSEALMESSKKWPGEKILVVTHIGVIRILVYHLMDKEFLITDKSPLMKSCLHKLIIRNNKISIKEINSISLETG